MAAIPPQNNNFYVAPIQCPKCGSTERYLSDNRCVVCRREYLKKRSQSPEGKAAFKKYRQSEKGKATIKAHVRYDQIKRTYNISKEQYDEIVKRQNQECAICHQPLENPCVDHNRKCCNTQTSCGKCVRGLLCLDCFTLVSKCKENVSILESALRYLRQT